MRAGKEEIEMLAVSDEKIRAVVIALLKKKLKFVPLEKILIEPILNENKFATVQMLGVLVSAGELEVDYPEEGAPSGCYRWRPSEEKALRAAS